MVNTFFVCYPALAAAKALDSVRLGKQRAEALNILNILTSAEAISQHYGYPSRPEGYSTKDDIAREVWLKMVFSRYKQEPVKLFFNVVNGERVYGPRGTLVGSGWSSHPMALMWVGYESALKDYINACIHEWLDRGFNNNMSGYVLFEDPVYPWWTRSEALHKSHRAALLRKEACREEPSWYWANPLVYTDVWDTEWYTAGYLWISHLSEQVRDSMKDGLDLHIYCDPVKNDFI